MQTTITKIFIATTLLVLITMTSQAYALSPVTINYKMKLESSKFGKATLGRLETSLKSSDNGYLIESVTKTQGMAAIVLGSNQHQSCEFEVLDGNAVSKKYNGGRTGKIDYEVDFDWASHKAHFKNKKAKKKKDDADETIDLPEGYIVDNCSMWFAVALLKGEIPNNQSMYVVDGKERRLRGYTLRSSDNETLATKLGDKQVTKVVFERELRPDRTLTFWLSHDDEYLPLKIEQSRKSRTITFEVRELNLDS